MAYTGPGSESTLLGGDLTVNLGKYRAALEAAEQQSDQLGLILSNPAYEPVRRGVFAEYPASTPKYSTSNGEKSLDTMARLLIPMPSEQVFNDFVNSFAGSPDAQRLARAIGAYEHTAQAAAGAGGLGYIDFLLTSVQESYAEKVQIVDLLSDNYIAYFFGSQPPIFRCQGVLLNTLQDDWRAAFTILYNDIIRGTQLARRRKVVTLAYDNMAVSGALINMNQVLTAEMQMASQLSFDLLVQRIDITRDSKTPLPTQTKSFPATVKPSTFAELQQGKVSVTIREAASPTAGTASRQKEVTPGEEPTLGEVSTTKADAYGLANLVVNELRQLTTRSTLPVWASFLAR